MGTGGDTEHGAQDLPALLRPHLGNAVNPAAGRPSWPSFSFALDAPAQGFTEDFARLCGGDASGLEPGFAPASSVEDALAGLTSLLVLGPLTPLVASHFRPLLPELVSRATARDFVPAQHPWHAAALAALPPGLVDTDKLLDIYEQVAIALACVLPSSEHLLQPILGFFAGAPALFEGILRRLPTSEQPVAMPSNQLRAFVRLARACFVLLSHAGDFFGSRWDWSGFVPLLDTSARRLVAESPEQSESLAVLAFLAAEITARLLNASDFTRQALLDAAASKRASLQSAEHGPAPSKFSYLLTSYESTVLDPYTYGLFARSLLASGHAAAPGGRAGRLDLSDLVVTAGHLGPAVCDVSGLLLNRFSIHSTPGSGLVRADAPSSLGRKPGLVPIDTTVQNLRRLGFAYSLSAPVLLHGPAGAGLVRADAPSSLGRKPGLVPIDTTVQNLRRLGFAYSLSAPVLLHGPAGAGKTSLVEELARATGQPELLKIHLGDQTDGKALLGTYVCTDVPGEFRWQAGVLTRAVSEGLWVLIEDINLAPMDVTDGKALLGTYVCTDVPGEFRWQAGVLTRAVSEGLWVLIEDINLAPMDVVSVLVPLLETRTLFLPARNERVVASPNFQLFATVTSVGGVGGVRGDAPATVADASSLSSEMEADSTGGAPGSEEEDAPSAGATAGALPCEGDDLFGSEDAGAQGSLPGTAEIPENLWLHVRVDPLTQKDLAQIIEARFPQCRGFFPSPGMEVFNVARHGLLNTSGALSSPAAGGARILSARDLFKWCSRLERYSTGSANLTQATRELLFREAQDCFLGVLPDGPRRRHALAGIAAVLGLPHDEAALDASAHSYRPVRMRSEKVFTIGRASLPTVRPEPLGGAPFAWTGAALRNMERIAAAAQMNEALLLVGETGTGKTTIVQQLASQLGRPLTVVNMSQQSESTDLLGGFKPENARNLCAPLLDTFTELFGATFSRRANQRFLDSVQKAYRDQRWSRLLVLFASAVKMAWKKIGAEGAPLPAPGGSTGPVEEGSPPPAKQAKLLAPSASEVTRLRARWAAFEADVRRFSSQKQQLESSFLFAFVEGVLVKAVQAGHWVLLDEINLATTETLECLSGLLESPTGSLVLTERPGDDVVVHRHPDFRIFACMNPATDVGKRDLPPGVRSRMTELYIGELERSEERRAAGIADRVAGADRAPGR
ncbi:hypothetical protein H696_01183 [Fonticula alba]|uniref:AAA+ ATPase domain-containing protein n=1 Tax=Fonticula alba TaxID=691883 RepID=A0A058ZBG6_FONAL|nr:hypothetical protein H696_01183 [Fonticula alba]KCV71765.1 hypothetical protein H696_01183 [Fonticula alba]|eukprot:XP_009493343.1 hypothetical protein H696_01183 [Fonticula alba]